VRDLLSCEDFLSGVVLKKFLALKISELFIYSLHRRSSWGV